MRTRINHGRFAVAVLLAASVAIFPQQSRATEAAQEMTVVTRTFKILEPQFGDPIVLPDEIPAGIQAEILKVLENTPATPFPQESDQFLSTLAGWIVVVIVIVVVAIIIWVVWKLTDLIPADQTNDQPDEPYPALLKMEAPQCDLQASTDLTNWFTAVTFHPSDSANTINIPAAQSGRMFFRLRGYQ